MVAIKGADVDRVLRRLDPAIVVILVYGPDTGLVSERARTAAESAIADPADPFQLVKIDGDAVAGDPARLVDEANTVGLFGGRRAVWVRPTARSIVTAVDAVLRSPIGDMRVVIEAGDLNRSSPLRALCERSPRAVALPCYADEGRGLGAVVDGALAQAGLRISRDARTVLLASLGGDRLATRAELEKLILYVHGRGEVGVEDVDAILSDVSSLALDGLVDAAFGGDTQRLDEMLMRLLAEGTAPAMILGALLRHCVSLFAMRAEVEAGQPASAAVARWPTLFFRRRDAVQGQIVIWPTASLQRAIEKLQDSVLAARREPAIAAAIASRCLLEIASQARAGRRTG